MKSKNLKQSLKSPKGITLIALVITIIVLLILAGVSISLVVGNNGVLSQASNSVTKTNQSEEKEQVEMAYLSAQMEKGESYWEEVTVNELQTQLEKNGVDVNNVTKNGTKYTITMNNGNVYEIQENDVTKKEENVPVGTKEDWDIDDDGTLRYFKGTVPADGTLVIPNVVDGIKVKKVDRKTSVANSSLLYFSNTLDYSLKYYDDQVKKIIISDGIETIGKLAFTRTGSLESVIIPDTVTSIGNFAFFGCTELTDITIPSGVTSIGEATFYDCTGLINITIPSSVTSIDGNAFCNCTALKNVTYTGTKVQWGNITIGSYANTYLINATITCTDGTIN